MSRDGKISFAPKGVNGKNRVPRYIWMTAIAAVVFGVVSFFAILAMNDFDLSRALGKRQETEETAEESTTEDAVDSAALQDLTDALNFLAICTDEKELTFCTVVSVVPSQGTIRVKPISPDFVLETAEGKMRLAEVVRRGAVQDVIEGLSRREIPIAKYVLVTEDNFISLLQKLGPVNIYLETGYDFTDGAVRYTYSAGSVSMAAEAMLSYMKSAAVGDELLRLQAGAAAAIIRTHFTPENVARGEDFFATLINLVTTDISVFDYTPAYAAIQALAESGVRISVIS